MREIADYWRNVAGSWDDSAYSGIAPTDWRERVATRTRGHIQERLRSAVVFLAPHADGRTFLELGCGSGECAVGLAGHGAAHVWAVDISPEVIERAQARAQADGVADKVTFWSGLVEEAPTQASKVDVCVGLGIIEYLEPDDVVKTLQALTPTDVFFSFHENRLEWRSLVHSVYRKLKRMHQYQTYTQVEMKRVLARAGFEDCLTYRENGNTFITTLVRPGT